MTPEASRSSTRIDRREIYRKTLHLSSLVAPAAVVWLGRGPVLVVLAIASVCALAGQVLQVRSHRWNVLLERVFGTMMRANERRRVGDPVALNGATWMVISAFLTFLIFPEPVAMAAFTVAVIGDTAAAFVGIRYGHHRIGAGRKTWEGSLGFVFTGLLIVAMMPRIAFFSGAAGVLAGAVAEARFKPLNDNVIVPFAAGAIMWLVQFVT